LLQMSNGSRKNIMRETVETICIKSKGPCRHKETWWWNNEVAEAVKVNKALYRNWQKSQKTHGRSKRRVVSVQRKLYR